MKLAFSLILALAAIAPAQDPSQFDLSTNDGVNAAREAIAGKPLDDRSKRCIHRNRNLPGIVVVGGFAFDYGCRLQGVFIKSSYVGVDDKSMSRSALESLGWKTAKQHQRGALAQAWVAKGVLGFLSVLSAKNEHFAEHSFQPPQASTNSDGEIVGTLWMRALRTSQRNDLSTSRVQILEGWRLRGNKTLENFTAPKD